MANTTQARKRIRQANKSRLHNMGLRSEMRTCVKKVRELAEKGDKEKAAAEYKITQSKLDSLVNKKIITKNKAARLKSKLNSLIKAIG